MRFKVKKEIETKNDVKVTEFFFSDNEMAVEKFISIAKPWCKNDNYDTTVYSLNMTVADALGPYALVDRRYSKKDIGGAFMAAVSIKPNGLKSIVKIYQVE